MVPSAGLKFMRFRDDLTGIGGYFSRLAGGRFPAILDHPMVPVVIVSGFFQYNSFLGRLDAPKIIVSEILD